MFKYLKYKWNVWSCASAFPTVLSMACIMGILVCLMASGTESQTTWSTTIATNTGTIIYNNLDYDAELQENGDLKITQDVTITLPYKSKGNWKSLYQRYTLNNSNLTRIKDISVTDITDTDNPVEYSKGEYAVPYDYTNDEWYTYQTATWYLADITDGNYPYVIPPAAPDDSISTEGNGTRSLQLGWHIRPTSSGAMRFRIGFTFQDVATTYNDATKLMWEPISADNQTPVEHVTGGFRFPKGFKAQQGKNAWAWLHCERPSTLTWHDEDSDAPYLTFEATGLYKNYLDLLVMFSPPDEHVARKATGDTIQSTIAEEQADQEAFNARIAAYQKQKQQEEQYKENSALIMQYVAFASLLIAVLMMLIWFVSIHAYSKRMDALYESDIDVLVSRGVNTNLVHMASFSTNAHVAGNAMSAAMLLLMSEGYITVVTGKRSWFEGMAPSSLTPTKLKLIMDSHDDGKRHHSLIIILKKRNDNKRLRALMPPCREIMEMLWDIQDTMNQYSAVTSACIDLSDLHTAGMSQEDKNRIYAAYSNVTKRIAAEQDTAPRGVTVPSVHGIGIVNTVVGCILSVALLTVCAMPAALWAFIAITASMLITTVLMGMTQYTPDDREANAIIGFRNYLMSGASFKTMRTLDVTLWGRLLSYATALGCADIVIDELRNNSMVQRGVLSSGIDDGSHYHDRFDQYLSASLMCRYVILSDSSSSPLDSLSSSISTFGSDCYVPPYGSSGFGSSSSLGFSGSFGGSGGGSFGGW